MLDSVAADLQMLCEDDVFAAAFPVLSRRLGTDVARDLRDAAIAAMERAEQ